MAVFTVTLSFGFLSFHMIYYFLLSLILLSFFAHSSSPILFLYILFVNFFSFCIFPFLSFFPSFFLSFVLSFFLSFFLFLTLIFSQACIVSPKKNNLIGEFNETYNTIGCAERCEQVGLYSSPLLFHSVLHSEPFLSSKDFHCDRFWI